MRQYTAGLPPYFLVAAQGGACLGIILLLAFIGHLLYDNIKHRIEIKGIIMLSLESTRRLLRRWFTSIPFFVVLGLVIGGLIVVPAIPKPVIAIVNISGTILGEAYVVDVLDMLHNFA